jgi:outer membrane autotransporter protein
MKKYLMGAALITVFATAAQANLLQGHRVGLTVGYSNTTARLADKDSTLTDPAGDLSLVGTRKKASGANIALMLGHGLGFGEKGHVGFDFNVSYDTAEAKIATGTFTPAGEDAVEVDYRYRGQLGLGLGVRAGALVMDNLLGFARVGVDYNFAKGTATDIGGKSYKDSMKVWSIVPGVGVEGSINDKMSWLAQVDYKIAFNMSKVNAVIGKFDKKPNSVIAKVGVIYSF